MAYKRTSPMPIVEGGTGDSSVTAYSVVCGGTTDTGALQVVSGLGSSSEVLTSNGAGMLPTWQTAGGGGGSATSWTPSMEFDGDSTGVTYTTLSGNYVKNGDIVNFYCLIALSSRGGFMGTEAVTITGLPLGAITGQSYQGLCSIAMGDSTIPIPYVYNDGMTTTIYLLDSVIVTTTGAPDTTNFEIIASDITDTSIFQITGSYITT